MNFKIESQVLHKLVQSVLPAISTKTPLEAYQCIRIEADGKGVILSATDGKVSLHAMNAAEINTPGILGVSARPLADIVSSLDNETLTVFLSPARNQVQLKTSRAACHLSTITGDQYPMIPNYSQIEFKEIPRTFFDTLERVSFCASREEDRAHLTGIYVTATDITAIDGFRLSSLAHGSSVAKPMLIPASGIDRIKKSLTGDKLFMAVGASEVHFQSGNCIATIRLLEGQFPNYNQVIPKDAYDVATVQRPALVHALKFVSNIADSMNRVRLEFKPGKLKLFAQSTTGDAEDIVECQCDHEFKIFVNAKFLLQGLEHLTKDTASFELRAGKPLVVREEGYVQVLMPQRE